MKSPGRRAQRDQLEATHKRVGPNGERVPMTYFALGGQQMRLDRLGFPNRAPERFGPFSRLGDPAFEKLQGLFDKIEKRAKMGT